MAGYDKLTPEGKRFFKEIKELNKLELRVGFQHGEKKAKVSERGFSCVFATEFLFV